MARVACVVVSTCRCSVVGRVKDIGVPEVHDGLRITKTCGRSIIWQVALEKRIPTLDDYFASPQPRRASSRKSHQQRSLSCFNRLPANYVATSLIPGKCSVASQSYSFFFRLVRLKGCMQAHHLRFSCHWTSIPFVCFRIITGLYDASIEALPTLSSRGHDTLSTIANLGNLSWRLPFSSFECTDKLAGPFLNHTLE